MKIFLAILFICNSAMASKADVKKEFARATKELKESGIEKQAIAKGVKAPDFKLGTQDFSDIYKTRPVVLKFYRGHWCPYCIKELKEYQSMNSEFSKYGKIIALVPDKEIEIKKTKKKFDLKFPIYRDTDNKIAKKFGLAFKVDKKVLELYKGYKIDLVSSQGNNNGELPMPGTYVVDTNGRIVYSFFDADYTKRADPKEVLAALEKAARN